MDSDTLNIISAIVAIVGPIITIAGFIISGILQKNSFHNDIQKIQEEKVYSKIEDLPHELLGIMHDIFNSGNNQEKITAAAKELFGLEDKIIAYGSDDAIAICCYVQERIYSGSSDPFETMAALGLLMSQLKKDLTSRIVLPDTFYRITIKDYTEQKDKIIHFSNEIISKLKIDERFKIDIQN